MPACPAGTICSEPAITPVGGSLLPTFTSTKVNRNSDGIVTGGTTTVYYNNPIIPGVENYIPVATTTDGGRTFTFARDARFGNIILSADAQRSLLRGALNATTDKQILTAARNIGLTPLEQQRLTNGLNSRIPSTGLPDPPGGAATQAFVRETVAEFLAPGFGGEGTDLRYPLTGRFAEQDHIKFTMFEYTPRTFAINNNLGAFGGELTAGGPIASVILPIQPQISDSNSVTWGESTLNAFQALAGAAAYNAINSDNTGGSLATDVESIISGVQSNKGDIKKKLAAYFAGQAANNNTFFTRATGAILNNNLELLFQGPTLRSFSFQFSMSARSQAESIAIRRIIRLFKQGMSVKRADTDLFLKSPNIFDIEYFHRGSETPWINNIKTCALQNISVNYTPAGNYATYDNGAMTQYDMSLSFGEIEPIYDDNYNELDGNANLVIGY